MKKIGLLVLSVLIGLSLFVGCGQNKEVIKETTSRKVMQSNEKISENGQKAIQVIKDYENGMMKKDYDKLISLCNPDYLTDKVKSDLKYLTQNCDYKSTIKSFEIANETDNEIDINIVKEVEGNLQGNKFHTLSNITCYIVKTDGGDWRYNGCKATSKEDLP